MGGGGGSGPTLQQQQLQTEQALTSANLNLEENAQRKSVLDALMGTRVFRGSALSRAVRGNTPGTGGEQAAPAPSKAQLTGNQSPVIVGPQQSLLDTQQSNASGNTVAGGAGASASPSRVGIYQGGSNARASLGNR